MISLSDWTDLPDKRGLETHIANLVIASFAEMDDRVWVRGGVPIDTPDLSKIQAGDALRTQPLPGESDWDTARNRFEVIFGEKVPTLRRGGLVQQFARQITTAATRYLDPAARLVEQLEQHSDFLRLDDTEPGGRLAIAHRSVQMLTELAKSGGGSAGAKRTVETLAGFDLADINPDRYATSIKSADTVISALATAAWENLALAQHLGPEGAALLDSLRSAARADQRSADLSEKLRVTNTEVTKLSKKKLLDEKQRRAEETKVEPQPVVADHIELTTNTSHPALPTDDESSPSQVEATLSKRSNKYTTTARQAARSVATELERISQLEPDAKIEITWKVVE